MAKRADSSGADASIQRHHGDRHTTGAPAAGDWATDSTLSATPARQVSDSTFDERTREVLDVLATTLLARLFEEATGCVNQMNTTTQNNTDSSLAFTPETRPHGAVKRGRRGTARPHESRRST